MLSCDHQLHLSSSYCIESLHTNSVPCEIYLNQQLLQRVLTHKLCPRWDISKSTTFEHTNRVPCEIYLTGRQTGPDLSIHLYNEIHHCLVILKTYCCLFVQCLLWMVISKDIERMFKHTLRKFQEFAKIPIDKKTAFGALRFCIIKTGDKRQKLAGWRVADLLVMIIVMTVIMTMMMIMMMTTMMMMTIMMMMRVMMTML